MLGLVGVALEIARVIFLIHPVQRAQDILCNSGLATKVAVRRMIGMIILPTIGTDILPTDFLNCFGSPCRFFHGVLHYFL